jgi:hypothetical protein
VRVIGNGDAAGLGRWFGRLDHAASVRRWAV